MAFFVEVSLHSSEPALGAEVCIGKLPPPPLLCQRPDHPGKRMCVRHLRQSHLRLVAFRLVSAAAAVTVSAIFTVATISCSRILILLLLLLLPLPPNKLSFFSPHSPPGGRGRGEEETRQPPFLIKSARASHEIVLAVPWQHQQLPLSLFMTLLVREEEGRVV
jgi:hypothetical protein